MSKTYFHVAEGSGDVFKFPIIDPGTKEEVYAIGTTDCENCVGIYIPLSDNKCFAAHIYACREESDDQGQLKPFEDWVPKGNQGVQLTTKIKSLLERRVRSHMPSKEDISRRANDVVVVCPRMTQEGFGDAVGTYVVDALQQFFDIQISPKKAHGFVVNHKTGESRLFRFREKDQSKRRDSFDFDAAKEDDNEMIPDEDYGWKKSSEGDVGQKMNWKLTHPEGQWQEGVA